MFLLLFIYHYFFTSTSVPFVSFSLFLVFVFLVLLSPLGFPLLHGSRKGFVVQITGGVFWLGKTHCKHGLCIEGNYVHVYY